MNKEQLEALRAKVIDELKRDAYPNVWGFVGEAMNRVNNVFDKEIAKLGPDF